MDDVFVQVSTVFAHWTSHLSIHPSVQDKHRQILGMETSRTCLSFPPSTCHFIFQCLLSHSVEWSLKPHSQSSLGSQSTCSGLVNNWTRVSSRFNTGCSYRPRRALQVHWVNRGCRPVNMCSVSLELSMSLTDRGQFYRKVVLSSGKAFPFLTPVSGCVKCQSPQTC